MEWCTETTRDLAGRVQSARSGLIPCFKANFSRVHYEMAVLATEAGPGLASSLPWRRGLIPACREIAIKRKAVKPGCHLSGCIALFALQPPDDGADQDM